MVSNCYFRLQCWDFVSFHFFCIHRSLYSWCHDCNWTEYILNGSFLWLHIVYYYKIRCTLFIFDYVHNIFLFLKLWEFVSCEINFVYLRDSTTLQILQIIYVLVVFYKFKKNIGNRIFVILLVLVVSWIFYATRKLQSCYILYVWNLPLYYFSLFTIALYAVIFSVIRFTVFYVAFDKYWWYFCSHLFILLSAFQQWCFQCNLECFTKLKINS